jgi:4-amino-4-deoxy-L-arabinose transferase-like glycosyltransferase
MMRRNKVWLIVAVLFVVVNVAGLVMAAMAGELLHTCGHAVLAIAGAYAAWQLTPRRWRRGGEPRTAVPSNELTSRLASLERSLDAAAVEVERIGEGQRFMTRLFTESQPAGAPGQGAPDAVELRGPVSAPPPRTR